MVMTLNAAPNPLDNMNIQFKTTSNPSTAVFIVSGEHEPSPKFVAGRCICKSCRSSDLTYYRYLDDAKCSCGQWQNEEPIFD